MVGLVLAAGRGTRMAPYTDAVSKELLPIADVPVIEYNLRYLEESGIKKVYVVLGEGKEQIVRYVKDGRRLNLDVAYLFQEMKQGAGTAKAVEVAKPWINQDFIVVYGDAFFHPGSFMKDMIRFHSEKGSAATIGLYGVEDPRRFGVVKVDAEGRVLDLVERPSLKQAEPFKTDRVYLVNSGPLIFAPIVFSYIEKTGLSPDGEYWITDTVKLMLRDRQPVQGFRIASEVFWRDVGTPKARLEADEYALRTHNR